MIGAVAGRAVTVRGVNFEGYVWRDPLRIVLAERSTASGPLVRHEMLHTLVGPAGHPSPYFAERCAGIVSCVDCPATARPEPAPANAVVLAASDLRVTVRVVPPEPSISAYDGAFALVIEAANPRNEPLSVSLAPTSPGAPFGRAFGMQLSDRHVPDYLFEETRRIGFAANEVRRYVFDMNAERWSPGMHHVEVFFSDNVVPLTFRVVP